MVFIMIIEQIYDMDQVKEILSIPEIWERAAEDGTDFDSFYPGFDTMCAWFICKIDNVIVGLIYAHHDNIKTLKIHPYILPENKGMGKDMMANFFEWVIKNCPEIIKLLVTIPFCYKKVYHFSRSVGFIDEGINRKSYSKKGEIFDQWNLGLTIDEIKGMKL